MSILTPRGKSSALSRKYVIMCAARTGSTMLVTALRAHPLIESMGESNRVAMNLFGLSEYGDVADRLRVEAPLLFSHVYDDVSGKPCRGFKFKYQQMRDFPELARLIEEDVSIRVIHLKRRNLLRQYLSGQIAAKLGSFEVLASRQTNPGAVVDVEWGTLVDHCRHCVQTEEQFSERYCKHPALEVFYESLVENSTDEARRIFEFLSLRPVEFSPTTTRVNPQRPSELISNISTFRKDYNRKRKLLPKSLRERISLEESPFSGIACRVKAFALEILE